MSALLTLAVMILWLNVFAIAYGVITIRREQRTTKVGGQR